MYTVSNIVEDVERGILAHNMVETCFVYRIVYFVNEKGIGKKYYVESKYEGLRMALENIIKGNLTTTNTVVVAAVTVRKDGESVSLLSMAYAFSLEEYFRRISGECRNSGRNGNIMYSQYAAR